MCIEGDAPPRPGHVVHSPMDVTYSAPNPNEDLGPALCTRGKDGARPIGPGAKRGSCGPKTGSHSDTVVHLDDDALALHVRREKIRRAGMRRVLCCKPAGHMGWVCV